MTYKLISDKMDSSVDEVIEWLVYFDRSAEIVRENRDDIATCIGNFFSYNISRKVSEEKDCVWWIFKSKSTSSDPIVITPTSYVDTKGVIKYLKHEKSVFLEHYFHYNRNRFLGYTGSKEINKLSVLSNAIKFNIAIPNTLITTSKRELLSFYKECNGEIVNKAIGNTYSSPRENGRLINYTENVSFEFINNLPDFFGLSLFQKAVKKKFEVRSFLLDSKFYSMAIFSQRNTQTATDFRAYDYEHPNRTRNIKLPQELESKLLLLASKFELETGSFDLIFNDNDEYVFLEVNPSGQFGMVSKPCNYYLEREIAKSLIKRSLNNA